MKVQFCSCMVYGNYCTVLLKYAMANQKELRYIYSIFVQRSIRLLYGYSRAYDYAVRVLLWPISTVQQC